MRGSCSLLTDPSNFTKTFCFQLCYTRHGHFLSAVGRGLLTKHGLFSSTVERRCSPLSVAFLQDYDPIEITPTCFTQKRSLLKRKPWKYSVMACRLSLNQHCLRICRLDAQVAVTLSLRILCHSPYLPLLLTHRTQTHRQERE